MAWRTAYGTHRGEDSTAYANAMDRLWDDAATGEQARRLILKAADDLRVSSA